MNRNYLCTLGYKTVLFIIPVVYSIGSNGSYNTLNYKAVGLKATKLHLYNTLITTQVIVL